MERRPEERALDRLILELREEASPELDWERIEARLMREPLRSRGALARFVGESAAFAGAGCSLSRWSRLLVLARKPAAVPAPAKQIAKLSTAP